MASAQQNLEFKRDKNWEQLCEKVKAQPLTEPHLSGPLRQDQLSTCDEKALYYGIGHPPDYAAALQCGWFQRAHPQPTSGNMFYGPGVLTMLYANGKGVARNYDLAIRFACENAWGAEEEMEYRIGHLERLRDGGAQTTAFDLCTDTTSGLSDGACTSIWTRKADADRSRKIDQLVERLPAAAKAEFPALQAAELAFEKARRRGEVDLSGTSRAAFELAEEKKLRDQFLINLQRFGRGDIPAATDSDAAQLDRKLNELYQQIQHSPAGKWEFGTVNPAGIRDTQDKWKSLLEAWTTFARVAYPNLPESSVRAQIIRLRLHQLHSLYPE